MADFDYAGALFSGKPQGAPADQQVDYASQLFSGVKPSIGTAPGLEKPPVAISEPSMGASAGTAAQAISGFAGAQRGSAPSLAKRAGAIAARIASLVPPASSASRIAAQRSCISAAVRW